MYTYICIYRYIKEITAVGVHRDSHSDFVSTVCRAFVLLMGHNGILRILIAVIGITYCVNGTSGGGRLCDCQYIPPSTLL